MTKPTRRGFLTVATGSAAGLLQARHASAAEASPGAAAADACILTPQAESGPYYIDPKLEELPAYEKQLLGLLRLN